MAETLSLKELKEQNAAADTAANTQETAKPKAGLVDDYVEEVVETKAGKAKETEVEDDDESETELESWMQPDEATSEIEKKVFKPNHEAAAIRKKMKAKLNERDGELDELRREIEQLKNSGNKQAQSEPELKRPKMADFDYDDDKYEAALEVYLDKKIESKVSTTKSIDSKRQEATQQQEQYKQELDEALDSHYSRASKLIADGKITEELYGKHDLSVRKLIEGLYPNQGDAITDGLIKTLNSLGEGSEKVICSLGVSGVKREKFESLLRKDILTATAYLGSLQSEMNSPNKRKSSAPSPAAKIQGDSSASGSSSLLKKQYDKATDLQTRLDLKRQAKKQNVDTKQW